MSGGVIVLSSGIGELKSGWYRWRPVFLEEGGPIYADIDELRYQALRQGLVHLRVDVNYDPDYEEHGETDLVGGTFGYAEYWQRYPEEKQEPPVACWEDRLIVRAESAFTRVFPSDEVIVTESFGREARDQLLRGVYRIVWWFRTGARL